MTIEFHLQVLERINVNVIHEAASEAARTLWSPTTSEGFHCEFEPGDATKYIFMVAASRRYVFSSERNGAIATGVTGSTSAEWLLATNFSGVYPFSHAPEWQYAADKWGNGNAHTGVIVSEFIRHFLAEIPRIREVWRK